MGMLLDRADQGWRACCSDILAPVPASAWTSIRTSCCIEIRPDIEVNGGRTDRAIGTDGPDNGLLRT